MRVADFILKNKFLSRAYGFAAKAHQGQYRKYTHEPYITHPHEVCIIVHGLTDLGEVGEAAALLHDVVEDTEFTQNDITREFGEEVSELVFWLTNISTSSDGIRAIRKELDRKHNARGGIDVMQIKIADMIHNGKSIVQ